MSVSPVTPHSLPVIDDDFIELLLICFPYRFPEENRSVLPLLTDKNGPEADTANHQCKRGYLFKLHGLIFLIMMTVAISHLCSLIFLFRYVFL